MSLPYHKPPPYERPNWHRLNEGQRRYAMEQYNLALVRRGAQFERPSVNAEHTTVQEPDPEPSPRAISEADHRDPFEDLDELDRLLDEANATGGRNNDSEEAEEPVQEAEPEPGPSHRPDMPGGVEGRADTTSSMETDVQSSVTGDAGRKRQKIGPSGSALPGTSGNTDGMTGAGGLPEGSVAIRNIPRGINTPTYHWSFTKKWKFLSFGVADQILNENVTTGGQPISRLCLTTSLANIPWEYAFFYMSPAEFTRIQQFNGVFATKCHIKIYQYNPRVAFQTADTTSTQATLNQNKFTRVAIGLRGNANLWGSDRDYVFDTTEPMKPTGFEAATENGQTFRSKLLNNYYGVANTGTLATIQSNVPAYCTGGELNLVRYFTVYATRTDDIGFPQYNRFCDEYNSMDMVGKCVTEQSYNFEYAPLKPRARNYQSGIYGKGDADAASLSTPTTFSLLAGEKIEVHRGKVVPAAGARNEGVTEATITNRHLQQGESATGVANSTFTDPTIMYYKFPMEQSGVYAEMNRKFIDYADQQSVHVGVRAVPKLGTAVNATSASSWLDTQMYWTVEAHLEVVAADPFTYPRGNVADIAPRGQIVGTAADGTTPIITTLDLPYQYARKQVVSNTFTV